MNPEEANERFIRRDKAYVRFRVAGFDRYFCSFLLIIKKTLEVHLYHNNCSDVLKLLWICSIIKMMTPFFLCEVLPLHKTDEFYLWSLKLLHVSNNQIIKFFCLKEDPNAEQQNAASIEGTNINFSKDAKAQNGEHGKKPGRKWPGNNGSVFLDNLVTPRLCQSQTQVLWCQTWVYGMNVTMTFSSTNPPSPNVDSFIFGLCLLHMRVNNYTTIK